MGYWEPTHGEDGTTGVGAILTTPVNNMLVGNKQILTKTMIKNNEPIIYYSGAVWDKAEKITNAKQWFNYLDTFYQQINNPLIVNVK
jgi:hypothetical protein